MQMPVTVWLRPMLYAQDRGERKIAFQMPLSPMIVSGYRVFPWQSRHIVEYKAQSGEMESILSENYRSHSGIRGSRKTDYRNLSPTHTFAGDSALFCCEPLAFIAPLRDAGVCGRGRFVVSYSLSCFWYAAAIQEKSKQTIGKFEEQYDYAAEHYLQSRINKLHEKTTPKRKSSGRCFFCAQQIASGGFLFYFITWKKSIAIAMLFFLSSHNKCEPLY